MGGNTSKLRFRGKKGSHVHAFKGVTLPKKWRFFLLCPVKGLQCNRNQSLQLFVT